MKRVIAVHNTLSENRMKCYGFLIFGIASKIGYSVYSNVWVIIILILLTTC